MEWPGTLRARHQAAWDWLTWRQSALEKAPTTRPGTAHSRCVLHHLRPFSVSICVRTHSACAALGLAPTPCTHILRAQRWGLPRRHASLLHTCSAAGASCAMSIFACSHSMADAFRVLQSHVRQCRDEACWCDVYLKCCEQWARLLPLQPDHWDDNVPSWENTWLWHTLQGGRLECVCLACEEAGMGRRTIGVRLSSLLKHHVSNGHQRAVALLLGCKPPEVAPPANLFVDVFHQLRNGLDVTGGLATSSGRVSQRKGNAMVWCLSEASLQMKRESIAKATCMNISRDERHGRLHVRYRCVDDNFNFSCGYLGQSRDHTTDSFGISLATEKIFEEFCLQDACPPEGSVPQIRPCANRDLYQHMCAITEAISVDSASNELVAAREQCSWHPDLGLKFLKNCKFILRDAAHSARRILGRGFGADAVLDATLGLFVHWKHSPGQLVHHSTDMQRLYAECCSSASDESAVTTTFTNMRAAKHRIETFSTPLSRCILNPSGLLSFLMKVAVQRKGRVEGKAAELFLETVCTDLLVQAAMLCDASSETLQLIRVMDKEDIPVADLCATTQAFLTRLDWMFNDLGVLHVDGHTRYILKWLERPHFISVNRRGRCLGVARSTMTALQLQWVYASVGEVGAQHCGRRVPSIRSHFRSLCLQSEGLARKSHSSNAG